MSEELYEIESGEQPSLATECGVVAVWVPPGTDAYPYVQIGAAVQQHRGQESAGSTIYTPDGALCTYADMGLVVDVLTDERAQPGNVGIGHERYSITGESAAANAQPFTLERNGFALSGAHNGNFFETTPLGNQQQYTGEASSDTAYAISYLLEQRQYFPNWAETLKAGYAHLSQLGSFNMVNITDDGNLFAAADIHANRPSSVARLPNGGMVISSETIAADKLGAAYMRPLMPGELLQVTPDGEIISHFFGEARRKQPCLLEEVYFMRPDAWDGNQRVRVGRRESGRLAAARMHDLDREVDVVVPVLDSGDMFAQGLADGLDVPIEKALTRDHYVGRTFIQPGSDGRRVSVDLKHNPTPDGIEDQRVAAGDDSLVRGNTMRKIRESLEHARAREVHGAFGSPPIVDDCDLGVAIEPNLPAAPYKGQPLDVIEAHMAERTGLASVTYLSVEDVTAAFGGTPETFCHHCMGGPHPIRDHEEQFPQKERPIAGPARLSVFASGQGTNLEAMLAAIEAGQMDAQVTEVVSNNPESYALVRAESRGIPTNVFPSRGQLINADARLAYNEQLMQHLEATMPDAVVLAGWMVILDDAVLRRMQELQIPVINLHPALLTPDESERITTSRGTVPIMRGTHAIERAYAENLPVSGVTVHQVLPDSGVDTGPIIYQEEVRRQADDTAEKWAARMHEAEYRALPTAIKRAVHVMKQNIDISQGTFPW